MLPVLSITAHLLAAIVWVGTLFSWGMLYTPALKRLEGYASVEGQLRRRLMLLQNICFGVLLLTGVYLMTQDIHYTGWLSFNNRWSQLLLLKHISIGFMILLLILLSGVVEPLRRQSALSEDVVALERLRRWERRIPRVQFVLATLILALSAALVSQ